MLRRVTPPATSTDLRVAIGMAGLVVVGALAIWFGFSPLLLLLASAGALTAAAASRLGWIMGLVLAPLALLALYVSLVQLYPDLGVPYGPSNAAVLALAGLLGAALVARWGFLRPSRPALVTVAAVGLVPAIVSLLFPVARGATGEAKLAWAMGNDSVWNVMYGRILVNDGGADPERHPSAAIGVHELIAFFIMPGRREVPAPDLLAHDLGRALDAMLLLLVAAAVLGGVAVARAIPATQLSTRVVVGMVASAVPFTWYVMGFAFRLGFWNSVFATVVLLAAWTAMTEARRHPAAATSALALAAICLLPIWTPTALIPLAMGAVVFVRHVRAHLRLRGTALALWLVPPAVLAWYGLFVIRPLLTAQGQALASDGAMFHISLTNVVVVMLLTVAATAMVAASGRGTDQLVVALTVAGATTVGLWYLMGQRAGAETGTWGYYPAKFGWTASILAVFVALHAVATLAARADPADRPSTVRTTGSTAVAGLAALALGLGLISQVPPADLRPQSKEGNPAPALSPDWRLESVLPPLSIADDDGMSEFDPSLDVLFELSSPGEKNVVSRLHEDPFVDGFINSWLLQQPGVRDNYDVRNFAYFLDSRDAEGICSLATTWGAGVTVTTSEPGWARKLRRRCPDVRFAVETVEPPTPVTGSGSASR